MHKSRIHTLMQRRHGPLFKYMEEQWAERLLYHGELRFTTLEECKRAERSTGIGDPSEGSYSRTDYITSDEWTSETVPEHLRHIIAVPPGLDQPVKVSGTFFEQHHSVPNVWLMCLTDRFNPLAMRRLGYDTAIRIDSPAAFYVAVAEGMHPNINEMSGGPVEYVARTGSLKAPLQQSPAYVKDPTFEYQDEVRFVLSSRVQPLEPLCISIPGVVGQISRVSWKAQ